MSVGTQLAQSQFYAEFGVGAKEPVRFTLLEWKDGKKRPHDLTQYDSVHLIFFDSDAAPSARLDVALTILSADDDDKVLDIDGETLVAARCSGEVTMTGAAGDIFAKLIGKKASTNYALALAWDVRVYLGGPNS